MLRGRRPAALRDRVVRDRSGIALPRATAPRASPRPDRPRRRLANTAVGDRECQDPGGGERAEHEARALDGAGESVRGRELLGRARRRSGSRAPWVGRVVVSEVAAAAAADVDDDRRGVHGHRDSREAEGRPPGRGSRQGAPGRDGNRSARFGDSGATTAAGDKLDERHEADARRPGRAVCVQQHRDPRPVLDRIEQEESGSRRAGGRGWRGSHERHAASGRAGSERPGRRSRHGRSGGCHRRDSDRRRRIGRV